MSESSGPDFAIKILEMMTIDIDYDLKKCWLHIHLLGMLERMFMEPRTTNISLDTINPINFIMQPRSDLTPTEVLSHILRWNIMHKQALSLHGKERGSLMIRLQAIAPANLMEYRILEFACDYLSVEPHWPNLSGTVEAALPDLLNAWIDTWLTLNLERYISMIADWSIGLKEYDV